MLSLLYLPNSLINRRKCIDDNGQLLLDRLHLNRVLNRKRVQPPRSDLFLNGDFVSEAAVRLPDLRIEPPISIGIEFAFSFLYGIHHPVGHIDDVTRFP